MSHNDCCGALANAAPLLPSCRRGESTSPASRCGRDRIAMRAPPIRRREPCWVCARAAAASIEEVRLEWKTACYYVACVPLPCQSDAFRSRTPKFHPPIHKPDGAPTRHAPHEREWSVSHAQGSRWGAGLSLCFFTQTLLFFLRQKRGRSRANGFLGMSEALRGQL